MRLRAQAAHCLAVIAGIAAIALTAACGSSTSSARADGDLTTTVTQAATTSSPTISACTTAHLTVALGMSDGAAGHNYLPLTFTNSGGAPCTISGYPGVSLVGGTDGHQIGNPAQRVNAPAVATLTLQPGAHAVTTIDLTQAGNYDPATCTPATATGFRVYPPNETNAALVTYAATGCSSTAVTILTVTSLVAGS